MRGVNEFVAAVADLVGGIGMLAFLSVLATLIVALLWYFWPCWLPRHWRLRFGFGRRGRQPGLGRSRWRLGALRWRWRLRWRRRADPGRGTRGPPARHAARPPSRGPRPHRGPARRGGTVRRGRARAAPGHRPRPRGPRCRAAGSRVDRHRDRHRGGPGPAGARRPGLRGRRHLLRDLVRAAARHRRRRSGDAPARRGRHGAGRRRRSPWSVRRDGHRHGHDRRAAGPRARPRRRPRRWHRFAPRSWCCWPSVGDHRGARDRGPRPRRPGHARRSAPGRTAGRLADCLAADGIAVERVTSGREAIRAATTGVATVFVPAPDFLHPAFTQVVGDLPGEHRVVLVRPGLRTLLFSLLPVGPAGGGGPRRPRHRDARAGRATGGHRHGQPQPLRALRRAGRHLLRRSAGSRRHG